MRQRNLQRARKARSRRALALIAAFGAMFALLVSTSGATLAGSTFNSTNGDLTSTALHDWNPAGVPVGNLGPVEAINCSTQTNCGTDLVKSQLDNAFGQGAKEDDLAPTIVSGQIPPSKDDLSRFYVNKEKAGGNDYLYLAWERSNLLGSAHMDFEFNQSSTAGGNGVTPVRTLGDLLIDFDFGGSGVPVLAKHTWVATATPGTTCETSNSSPCWNKATNLTTGGFADGSVNSANVTDNNAPGNPRTLAGNTKNGINSTFGEAAINLTGAGVFSAGTCTHFGSAYLKSRSSGNSFSSELKDFIAPIPVNISNCGTLTVKKVTDPSPDPTDQSFDFTVSGPAANANLPASPSLKNGESSTSYAVFAGTTFSAAETVPANWSLESATCDNGSGTLSGSTISDISVAVDEDVLCTFTNQLQLGAIKITKTSTKGDAPLGGATFEVKDSTDTVVGTPTSDDTTGVACVDSLPLGSYTVTETAAPTGYGIDDTAGETVSVTASGTCGSGNEATISFSDTPLSEIQVQFRSLAGADVTKASIDCGTAPVSENGSADPAFDDTDETITNLAPGTYTCTVVVDP
jgi:hypothetical protein